MALNRRGRLLISCSDSAAVEAWKIIDKVEKESDFLCIPTSWGNEEKRRGEGGGGVEGAPRGGYLFGGEHFLGRGCLFKEILNRGEVGSDERMAEKWEGVKIWQTMNWSFEMGSNSGEEQVKNRTRFLERTNQWIKNVSFKERGRVKHRDVKRVNIPLTKCCVGFCIPYVLSLVFQRMYTFLNSFRTWRFFKIKQDCEIE